LSETQYQVAFHPDEVNCNVHKTLVLTMNLNMETIRKSFRSTFEENTRRSLKA